MFGGHRCIVWFQDHYDFVVIRSVHVFDHALSELFCIIRDPVIWSKFRFYAPPRCRWWNTAADNDARFWVHVYCMYSVVIWCTKIVYSRWHCRRVVRTKLLLIKSYDHHVNVPSAMADIAGGLATSLIVESIDEIIAKLQQYWQDAGSIEKFLAWESWGSITRFDHWSVSSSID